MSRVYGITGSIASGKSTTTQYLVQKGYKVVDADKIVKKLQESNEEVIRNIIETFNVDNNGKIDRKKLAELVFNNPVQKGRLEAIMHPLVIEEMKESVNKTDGIIFLDIPLLYEADLKYLCDEVIVIYAPEDTLIERIMKRNKLSKVDAQNRIQAQMSIDKKKELADIVIDNSRDLDHLYKQIDELLLKIGQ